MNGPRPVKVKRAVVDSKGLSRKMFCDWSIMNIQETDSNLLAAIFEITSHCFCLFSLHV